MSRPSTPAGKAHTKPWRVTWYVRDAETGRPLGGGHRAFVLQERATSFAAARRAEGYTAEVWCADALPGVP